MTPHRTPRHQGGSAFTGGIQYKKAHVLGEHVLGAAIKRLKPMLTQPLQRRP